METCYIAGKVWSVVYLCYYYVYFPELIFYLDEFCWRFLHEELVDCLIRLAQGTMTDAWISAEALSKLSDFGVYHELETSTDSDNM